MTKYVELDCSIFRYKELIYQTYNKPMGKGNKRIDGTPEDKWNYPQPNSSVEGMYKEICEEHQ